MPHAGVMQLDTERLHPILRPQRRQVQLVGRIEADLIHPANERVQPAQTAAGLMLQALKLLITQIR